MEELLRRIKEFNKKRDWDRFHTPKNLVMGISIETAEIMEHFIWLTPEESAHLPKGTGVKIKNEIGDVMIYLLNLCDKLGIDPIDAALEKLEMNELKYPAAKSKGKALKYTDL